jgi:hypothetical protein
MKMKMLMNEIILFMFFLLVVAVSSKIAAANAAAGERTSKEKGVHPCGNEFIRSPILNK